jgi:hypothetical protein
MKEPARTTRTTRCAPWPSATAPVASSPISSPLTSARAPVGGVPVGGVPSLATRAVSEGQPDRWRPVHEFLRPAEDAQRRTAGIGWPPRSGNSGGVADHRVGHCQAAFNAGSSAARVRMVWTEPGSLLLPGSHELAAKANPPGKVTSHARRRRCLVCYLPETMGAVPRMTSADSSVSR